jgi:hypothetical protein
MKMIGNTKPTSKLAETCLLLLLISVSDGLGQPMNASSCGANARVCLNGADCEPVSAIIDMALHFS